MPHQKPTTYTCVSCDSEEWQGKINQLALDTTPACPRRHGQVLSGSTPGALATALALSVWPARVAQFRAQQRASSVPSLDYPPTTRQMVPGHLRPVPDESFGEARVLFIGAKCSAVRRPVASSMNTISVERGPRHSNQACGLPSIWINSPNRGRRSQAWNTRLARRVFGRHRPSAICICRSVSADTAIPADGRELLGRQRRSETLVLALQQRRDRSPAIRGEAAIRRPPALARHQTRITHLPPVPQQPLELPHSDAKPLRTLALAHPLLDVASHQRRPITLRRAHP